MLQMSPGWNRAVLSKGKLSLLHRATPARKRKSTRVIGRRGSSITEDEAAESNKFHIPGTTAICLQPSACNHHTTKKTICLHAVFGRTVSYHLK